MLHVCVLCFFFFNDTATTEIYTLSLHDALPISRAADGGREDRLDAGVAQRGDVRAVVDVRGETRVALPVPGDVDHVRSEEHTSELQSRQYLVCRLLLEKKKNTSNQYYTDPTTTR